MEVLLKALSGNKWHSDFDGFAVVSIQAENFSNNYFLEVRNE